MKISSRLSNYINLIRWFAAFLVVINHTRALFFVSYESLTTKSLLAKGIYFMTGFGREAVIIFFVLSGFLVGAKALDKIINGTFDWRSYFLDRASRIYIIFLPALIIGGMLDIIGSHYFDELHLYDGTHGLVLGMMSIPPIEQLSPIHFLGNVGMLQTIFVPPLGSNAPLWSLAYEFWYYLLFPALMLIIFRKEKRYQNLAISLVIILLISHEILLYFSIWLLGVALYYIKRALIPNPYLSFLPFILILFVIRVDILDGFLADFLLAFVFMLVINSIQHATDKQSLAVSQPTNQFLSNFSYSLYAFHLPLLFLFVSIIFTLFNLQLKAQLSTQYLLIAIILISIIYAITYFVARLTEYRTKDLREYLYEKFNITGKDSV